MGVDVDLSSFDRLMSEPQRDDRGIDTRVQQFHRGTVTKDMRRDAFVFERSAASPDLVDVLPQQMLNGIRAERLTFPCGEKYVGALGRWPFQPGFQHRNGLLGEGRAAFLPSLADAAHVRAGVEGEGFAPQADQLRKSQTRLQGQKQQRVVAPAEPGAAVRGSHECLDLRTGQKAHLAPKMVLAWNGEDALKVSATRGLIQAGEMAKRTDGGETQITGTGAVVALLFEVVEESADKTDIEIRQIEAARWFAECFLCELEQ